MKSQINKFLSFLLFLLITGTSLRANPALCLTPMAGNYTIDHTMVTGGTNFQTFSDAVAALTTCGISAAVHFSVAQGTYTEQVVIGAITGTSATNTITFDGVDRDTRKITFSYTDPANPYLWRINGTSHLIIKNLTFEPGDASTPSNDLKRAIHIRQNAQHLQILNNRFIINFNPNEFSGSSNKLTAIVASASDNSTAGTAAQGINVNHVKIEGNHFDGSSYGVIMVGPSAAASWLEGILINDNLFTSNTYYAIDIINAKAPVVTNNTVNGIQTFDTEVWSATSAGFFRNISHGFTFSNNKIYNYGVYGINLLGVNTSPATSLPIKIHNNIFSGANGSGTRTSIFRISNAHNVEIWHNSVYIDKGWYKIFDVTSNSTGIDIRNNASSKTFGTEGQVVSLISNVNSITAMSNNSYYAPGGIFSIGGINYNSLTDITTATGLEANSKIGDPQWHLPSLMPYGNFLYNSGANIGLATDIYGNSRNINSPALGAIEAGFKTNDVGVTAILSPKDLSRGDEEQEIVVEITNFGTQTQSSIPVTVQISGDINTSVSNIYPGPIMWGQKTIFSVGEVNTAAGGNIEINVFTSLSVDEEPENNGTSVELFLNSKPAPPVVSDQVVCPGEEAMLLATGFDEFNWYRAGSLSSNSNPYIFTPDPGVQTVEVEGYNVHQDSLIQWHNYNTNVICPGNKGFEVTAGEHNDILLTGIALHAIFIANIFESPIDIYYYEGTYKEGETGTLVISYPTYDGISSSPAVITFPQPILIRAGETISMNITEYLSTRFTTEPMKNSNLIITPRRTTCSFDPLALPAGGLYYTAITTPSDKSEAIVTVPTIDAGNNDVVYYGYTPMECTTLTVSGTFVDDPLSSISWSNGATSASITVCPTVTTTYTVTVTDQYGCTYSDEITVCVVDVRCQNGKVSMCKNPGSNGKWTNICVAPEAVEAQLKTGASLGACGTQTDCGNVALKKPLAANSIENLELALYPNPTSGMVNINLSSDVDEVVEVQLYSVTGQLQKVIYSGNIAGSTTTTLNVDASDLPQGTYLVRVSTVNSIKQTKLFITK